MRTWPVLVALLGLLLAPRAEACPFCSAVSQTFSEEMSAMDVVVIGRVVQQPKAETSPDAAGNQDVPKTKFEVLQVIKGKEALGGRRQIEVLYFGQQPKETRFLIMGVEPPQVSWNTPVPLTERAVAYITRLPSLPEKGADRLAFFQDYFEDPDEMLARDAYDEFAKAPYSDVKALKDRMQRDKLRRWIQDNSVLASRKRLYLTMLGICGGPEDVAMLEEMITRDEPAGEPKTALDAMIACYLTLKGPEGLPLIEERFLQNDKAEYTDTYSAIMALRFHGQEEQIIPKERLVEAMRHMLDRPQLADLIIPDLARWQDWKSMDRLVQLFKEADEESSWVRVPVVQYLRACPLPEAQQHIAELEKIDPDAVKRASFFVPLGAATAQKPADGEKPGENEKTANSAPRAAQGADAPRSPTDSEAGRNPAAETSAGAETAASQKRPAETARAGETPATAEAQQPADEKRPALAAARDAPSRPATPVSGTPGTVKPTSAKLSWMVIVPVGVGLVLLALFLVILRGVGSRTREAKS